MTFRIGLVTDTHLSRERPFFNRNFAVLAQAMRSMSPDLVLNMGDMTLDGCGPGDDLEFARGLHQELGLEWTAIPGNHDVGDNQETGKTQLITHERRQRWIEVIGPDFWTRDVLGWRLLGINSLLLGSNLPEAREQEEFISDAMRGRGDRQLALFLHKPLYYDTLDESEFSSHGVNPEPRQRLLAALGDERPALVCCGHRHEYRERTADGMHQIWGPAGSFTLADWFMPTRGGTHVVGMVDLQLFPDGRHTSALVRPDGIQDLDLADFPDAYGDLRLRAKHAA